MDEDRKPAEPESMAADVAGLMEAWRSFGKALADILDGVLDQIYAVAERCGFGDVLDAAAVSTPRQWHLLRHGKPRTRNKWRNALRRKAEITKKRGGKNNG